MVTRSIDELIIDAGRAFDEAHEKLRDGDWQGYGEMMDELERIIQDLEDTTGR